MEKLELTNFKNLPTPISTEELKELFHKFHNENMKARDKIITYNLKLVVSELYRKYWKVLYDKNDMFEIGVMGLIKAVDSFDITKEICFSTYAVTCIDNEINKFLSKFKFEPYDIELTTPITNASKKTFYYDDIKNINKDIIEDIDDKLLVYKSLNYLNERDRKILILYYGLFNNKSHSQRELAEMFKLSKTGIAYIIEQCLCKMKKYALNPNLKTNKKRK